MTTSPTAACAADRPTLRSSTSPEPGCSAGPPPLRDASEPLRQIKQQNYARYVLSLLELKPTARNMPLELDLEMANSCNLNCKFCMLHGKPDRAYGRSGLMPEPLLEKVVPFFAGAAFTCLHGHGEPFMNPALVATATAARAQGVFVEFFTNGRMLSEARARQLIEAKVTRLFISISTADPRLYEHLYERGHFELLRKNLERLQKEKQRLGTEWPRIHFNAIAFRSTLPGLVELVDFAGQHGVAGIDLKPMVVYPHLGEIQHETITYDPEQHEPLLQAAEARARERGLELYLDSFRHGCPKVADDEFESERATPEEEGIRLEKPCPLVYRTMYVTAAGDTKPCAFASKNPAFSLGNLHERTVEEIWNGPRYRELRQAHVEGRVHPICRRCLRLNLAPPRDAAGDWLRFNGYRVYEYERAVQALTRASSAVAAANEHVQAAIDRSRFGFAAMILEAMELLVPSLSNLEAEAIEAEQLLPGLDAIRPHISTVSSLVRELRDVMTSRTEPPHEDDIRETVRDVLIPALERWPALADAFVSTFYEAHERLAEGCTPLTQGE